MDTRFERSFEDADGNYHHVNTRVFHSYFSLGFGKAFEMNKLHLGGTVDLAGGFGIIVFKKDYTLASGQNIKFSEKFGFDLFTGYQLAVFMDLNNFRNWVEDCLLSEQVVFGVWRYHWKFESYALT